MTLEDAITHCKEKGCGNTQCALEHRQLTEWLQELQQYRKNARKEQPKVDLVKEFNSWLNREKEDWDGEAPPYGEYELFGIAQHFYELGRNQVLQELYKGKIKPFDKIAVAWLDDESKDKEDK